MTKQEMINRGQHVVNSFTALKMMYRIRLNKAGYNSNYSDKIIDKVMDECILPMAKWLNMKYDKSTIENAYLFMDEDGMAYLRGAKIKIERALESKGI